MTSPASLVREIAHIVVQVTRQLVKQLLELVNYVLVALGRLSDSRHQGLNRLGYIHADVCHSVLRERDKDGQELTANDVGVNYGRQSSHTK